MTADHPRFDEALALLDAGDAERLRELLADEPELVRARVTTDESPYETHFAGRREAVAAFDERSSD